MCEYVCVCLYFMCICAYSVLAIFGQRLEETMKYEQMKNNRKVPEIVEMCVEFLNKHGVQTEGVFR